MSTKAYATKGDREMSATCKKCRKEVKYKDTIICAKCNHRYEFDCAGVSEKLYRLMKPEAKKNWKCNICARKSAKLLQSSNRTPSYVTMRKNKPVKTPSDKITSSTPNSNMSKNTEVNYEPTPKKGQKDEQSSQTLKTEDEAQDEKYTINISTENSFGQLCEESSENVSASLTSTPIADTNRSFPELRSNNSYKMDHLREKIARLELNLNIAENEIENLVADNQNLKKQITEYELKIRQLTHICKSTPNTASAKKNKPRRVPVTEENLSRSYLEQPKKRDRAVAPSPSSMKNYDHNHTKHYQILKERVDRTTSTPRKPEEGISGLEMSEEKPKKRIFILGDESLKGLSATLLKTREGKWNDVYKTFAFIVTDASSTDIIPYCDIIQKDLNENDIVILGLGSHDDNIHVLHSNLCIALSKLKKASILLLPIHYNCHFNEKTLNYNMKLWINHFSHCTFIDISNLYLNDYYNYLNFICNKINVCIDYKEYESQFLDFSRIKNRVKSRPSARNCDGKLKIDATSKYTTRPGTIPYYFQKISRRSKAKVPSYFHSIKDVARNDIESPDKNISTFFRA